MISCSVMSSISSSYYYYYYYYHHLSNPLRDSTKGGICASTQTPLDYVRGNICLDVSTHCCVIC